jgi:dTMP kinase
MEERKGKGLFITLEGGEGSGKTTMIEQLCQLLDQEGQPYMVSREPGGIRIAEGIRELLLHPEHTEMDVRTEALLYAAARRQHLVEKVEPALNEGKVVLCDRFIDSSLAYQGYARGIGIAEVLSINAFATEGRFPDHTFYLDVDPEVGLARIAAGRGHEVNRLDLEAISFHHLVREGYQKIAAMYPQRISVIDASGSAEEVAGTVRTQLKAILKEFRANLSNK